MKLSQEASNVVDSGISLAEGSNKDNIIYIESNVY